MRKVYLSGYILEIFKTSSIKRVILKECVCVLKEGVCVLKECVCARAGQSSVNGTEVFEN